MVGRSAAEQRSGTEPRPVPAPPGSPRSTRPRAGSADPGRAEPGTPAHPTEPRPPAEARRKAPQAAAPRAAPMARRAGRGARVGAARVGWANAADLAWRSSRNGGLVEFRPHRGVSGEACGYPVARDGGLPDHIGARLRAEISEA